MYYAIITNEKIDGKGQCPCSGNNTFSIEITEEVYNNLEQYIYSDGQIILNPNYEQEELEKKNRERNLEIDEKIKELSSMASVEMIKGNTSNVALYNEVIQSLEEARP